MKNAVLSFVRLLVLAAAAIGALPVLASDHGGASGPEPFKFTVNVGNLLSGTRFLQVEMVFEFAKPEIAHHLMAIKPKVQHQLILMLSGMEIPELQTTKGKLDLMGRIVAEMNHLLHESEDSGVKEVLFTNFIIQ